jgi:hypothetical protein
MLNSMTMSFDPTVRRELLSPVGWEVRALGEAQLRSLTAMQRCIDEFQRTGDPEAAEGVRRHIRELQERSPQVLEAIRFLITILDEVAPASGSPPPSAAPSET